MEYLTVSFLPFFGPFFCSRCHLCPCTTQLMSMLNCIDWNPKGTQTSTSFSNTYSPEGVAVTWGHALEQPFPLLHQLIHPSPRQGSICCRNISPTKKQHSLTPQHFTYPVAYGLENPIFQGFSLFCSFPVPSHTSLLTLPMAEAAILELLNSRLLKAAKVSFVQYYWGALSWLQNVSVVYSTVQIGNWAKGEPQGESVALSICLCSFEISELNPCHFQLSLQNGTGPL